MSSFEFNDHVGAHHMFTDCKAKTVYVKTQKDMDLLSLGYIIPVDLTFVVK